MAGLSYTPPSGASIATITATDYADLIANYPTGPGAGEGAVAYVSAAQGTSWLPGSLGGSYYGKGWYEWSGAAWVEANDAIEEQLQKNIGTSSNISTNTNADIYVGTYRVDTSSSDVTVTLPASTDVNKTWTIKKLKDANRVLVEVSGGGTIDEETQQIIIQKGTAIGVQFNGTDYDLVWAI